MKRREFISLLGGATVGWPLAADAQHTGIVRRIGYLNAGLSGASASPVLEGFRQGLRERGYVEAKSIAIEYRFDEGNLARLPSLAAELVRLKVDVIVAAGGTPAILTAPEDKSQTWQQKTGCQRSPVLGQIRRPVFSCPTERTVPTWGGARQSTWTRS